MIEFGNYTGCRVFIRDEITGDTIASTTVKQCDKKTLTISVDNSYFERKDCERVTLLIIYDDALYEFRGNVRKSSLLETREIALFQGQEKEGRSAKRYYVKSKGYIENIVLARHLIPLPHKTEVMVINISTDGALIKASAGTINVGTTFELKLKIENNDLAINAKVIRINKVDNDSAEYGCKFNFIY